jgi:hypothetical protein
MVVGLRREGQLSLEIRELRQGIHSKRCRHCLLLDKSDNLHSLLGRDVRNKTSVAKFLLGSTGWYLPGFRIHQSNGLLQMSWRYKVTNADYSKKLGSMKDQLKQQGLMHLAKNMF